MREEDLSGGIGGVEGGVGDAHAIFTHAPVTRPRPTDLAHVKYWRIFSSSVPLFLFLAGLDSLRRLVGNPGGMEAQYRNCACRRCDRVHGYFQREL